MFEASGVKSRSSGFSSVDGVSSVLVRNEGTDCRVHDAGFREAALGKYLFAPFSASVESRSLLVSGL